MLGVQSIGLHVEVEGKALTRNRGVASKLMAMRSAWAVVAAILLAGPCGAQAPGVYRIDHQASRIEIHVFRGGALGGLGDNHQIFVSHFSGTAEQLNGKGWEVRVEAESGSLVVEDPGLSVAARREVQRTMLGPTQLDVARYPKIELVSRAMLPGDMNTNGTMRAEVTLHGVTRQEEFPLAWSEEGDRMRVRGRKELRLQDFHIKPIRKALGTIQVRNQFEVVYDIVLVRAGLGRSK